MDLNKELNALYEQHVPLAGFSPDNRKTLLATLFAVEDYQTFLKQFFHLWFSSEDAIGGYPNVYYIQNFLSQINMSDLSNVTDQSNISLLLNRMREFQDRPYTSLNKCIEDFFGLLKHFPKMWLRSFRSLIRKQSKK